MLIIDAHLDLAWNAIQWGRDLTLSAHTIRTQEGAMAGKGRGQGTVALPELRRGRIAISIVTLIARSTGRPVPHLDFAGPAQAYGAAMGHLAYYRALERQGHARVIIERGALERHTNEWRAWEAAGANEPSPPLGFVISMEGADPVLDPDQLAEWYNLGLRLIGPAHYGPCRYAGGTGTELGLGEQGPALLKAMQQLGIALDLTHLSDQAFWEALRHYDGLLLASHNNCRALVPQQRQFSDEQIKAIAERDGVIGATLDSWMLKAGWLISERPHPQNPPVSLNDVVDHIDHVCQLTGNSRHAAIGSDLDGGFGREQSPDDLDTIADLQRLPDLLAGRGYNESDIAAIMHGNWLRFLGQLLAE